MPKEVITDTVGIRQLQMVQKVRHLSSEQRLLLENLVAIHLWKMGRRSTSDLVIEYDREVVLRPKVCKS